METRQNGGQCYDGWRPHHGQTHPDSAASLPRAPVRARRCSPQPRCRACFQESPRRSQTVLRAFRPGVRWPGSGVRWRSGPGSACFTQPAPGDQGAAARALPASGFRLRSCVAAAAHPALTGAPEKCRGLSLAGRRGRLWSGWLSSEALSGASGHDAPASVLILPPPRSSAWEGPDGSSGLLLPDPSAIQLSEP